MSNARKFVLINDLKPFKDEWRICVKLLHSWKSKTDYGGETFECIFADKTGQKIHASCQRRLMFRVQRDTKEGEWREIENFKVSAAGGQYRPSKYQYKMTIIGDTAIRPTDYRNDNRFLSLASYEDIRNGQCNPFFLIDVMGQVVDLGGVTSCQLKSGESRKRVQFRLRDTSGNELACCLWGTYTEQIQTYVEESKDETIICLIRFAKIKEFRGEVQITNAFGASVLMFDPPMEEVVDFKQKMLQDDLPLALLAKSDDKKIIKTQAVDDWNEVDIRSISEICLAVEAEPCKIVCTIEAIDTDWGWFYFGCKRHNLRTTRVGRNGNHMIVDADKPLFYCEMCHANITNVLPKYKLHVFVKDDTGSCHLMLLDTVARTIIGDEAVQLWDGSYAEVGKSFCFGISIKSDNITNGSDTFKVSEVWSGDHIHRIESLSEPISQIETNSSTLSTSEVLFLDQNREISSDVSTPFSKRKEGGGDVNDLNSTSKKLCAKSIKMEKSMQD